MTTTRNEHILIRSATPSDLDAVVNLDESGPAKESQAYWRGVFGHYVSRDRSDRLFLVTEINSKIVGFIICEIRAWEFGSPPCGWVFTLLVSPHVRKRGIGQLMFDETCKRLKRVGVTRVRTMVERDNRLSVSFFRSQGLYSGRYIELEKSLE